MAGGKRSHDAEEIEEVFVRGGGDLLTPLEKRQIAQKAAADFDQETQNKSKRSKHAKQEASTNYTVGPTLGRMLKFHLQLFSATGWEVQLPVQGLIDPLVDPLVLPAGWRR
jgi:hypothetical protein